MFLCLICLYASSYLSVLQVQEARSKKDDPTQSTLVLSAQELFGRVAPFVYVVEALDEGGEVVSIASAVAIDKGELVTNKHAIGGTSFRIRRGTKSWPASVGKLDETADLCLLRADVPDVAEPLAIRSIDSLKIGERVFAVGAPYGLELSLSDGLIAGRRQDQGVTLVQTTAPISKGSSGGGLFDAQGELVGITTFYLSGAQNLNFAIAAERISILKQQTAEGSARAWAALASGIADNAWSVAGIEPEPPPSDPRSFNDWAERMKPRIKVVARERARAAHAYAESLRLNPNDSVVWVKLGSLYAWLEEPEKMRAAFNEALRLRPNDTSVLTSFGEAYDHVNEHPQAVQMFRDATSLQPGNADLWVGLANVLAEPNGKEAAKALQRAEQLRPTSALLWSSIGLKYEALGRYRDAEAALQEAVKLEPNDVFSWGFLGDFYALRRNKHRFQEVVEHLRRIDPDRADSLQRVWR